MENHERLFISIAQKHGISSDKLQRCWQAKQHYAQQGKKLSLAQVCVGFRLMSQQQVNALEQQIEQILNAQIPLNRTQRNPKQPVPNATLPNATLHNMQQQLSNQTQHNMQQQFSNQTQHNMQQSPNIQQSPNQTQRNIRQISSDRTQHNIKQQSPNQMQGDVQQSPNQTQRNAQKLPNRTTKVVQMFAPGSFIGKYKILQEIGRGGMGAVYKAYDVELQRTVAIKVVLPNALAQNPTLRKRFEREIQISANLKHPNIVEVYNAGAHGNLIYLVMTFVEGISLHQYLKHYNISLPETLEIIEQIARALDYAHQQKIVHRDIKPSNIMLTANKQPLLMDFGLARSFQIEDKKITRSGEVMGTPNYMSPEQLLAAKMVDGRSDIYALGAILYEIISKQQMVTGKGHMEIFYNVCYATPIPLKKLCPEIPKEIDTIWRKATISNPNQRYARASDFADDIQRYLQHGKIKTKAPLDFQMLMRRYKKSIAVAALILGCIVTTIAYQKKQQTSSTLENLENIKKQQEKTFSATEEIYIAVKDNKYQEAIEKFQVLTDKQKNAKVYFCAAQAYYHQGLFSNALDCLEQTVADDSSILQAECQYYKGLIALRQKDFMKAQKHFSQASDILGEHGFSQEIPQNRLLHHLGICYFHTQQYTNAIKSLTKASEKISDSAEIYFYLAQSYMRKLPCDLNAAEIAIRRCLELQPNISKYHSLYGDILSQQHKFFRAEKYFTTALDLEPENSHALQRLFEVALESLHITFGHTIKIDNYRKHAQNIAADIFEEDIRHIEHNYQETFSVWQSLQKQSSQNPFVFFQQYQNASSEEVKKASEEAIWSLRYHPGFTESFRRLRTERLDLTKLYNKITQHKQRELLHICYYCLAQICLEKNPQIINLLQKNSELLQKVQSIISNPQEDTLIRYLAAKSLISLLLFRDLENYLQHQDLSTKVIVSYVLRKSQVMVDNENYLKQLWKQGCEDPILQIFVLENYKPKKPQLEQLLQAPNKKIQLYTATNILRFNEGYPVGDPIVDKAKQIFIDTMRGDSLLQYKVFSCFQLMEFFANHNPKILSQDSKIRKFFIEMLQEGDEYLRKAILVGVFKIAKQKDLQETIRHLAKNHQNLMLQIHALSVLGVWEDAKFIEEFVHDSSQKEILRFYAMRSIISGADSHKDKSATSALVKQLPLIKQLCQKPSPYIQAYSILTLTSIDFPSNYLEIIDKTTSEFTKAFLLVNVTRRSFIEHSENFSPEVKLFVDSMCATRSKQQKKLVEHFCSPQISNKYANHRSPQIRKAFYLMKTVTTPAKFRKKLYQEAMSSQDPSVRDGVSRGFYQSLLQEMFIEFFRHRLPFDASYSEIYNIYARHMLPSYINSSKKRQEIINLYTWAINLSPQYNHYYERAILMRERNPEAAMADIRQASQIENSPSLKLLEAEVLYRQGNHEKVNEIITEEIINTTQDFMMLQGMAEILEKIGQKQRARKCYYKMIDVGRFRNNVFLHLAKSFMQEDVELAKQYLIYQKKIYLDLKMLEKEPSLHELFKIVFGDQKK